MDIIDNTFFYLTPDEQIEVRASVISLKYLARVERVMDQKGINRADLAKLLGTSKSYLTQLWRGDKLINLKLLARIENALNINFLQEE